MILIYISYLFCYHASGLFKLGNLVKVLRNNVIGGAGTSPGYGYGREFRWNGGARMRMKMSNREGEIERVEVAGFFRHHSSPRDGTRSWNR